MRPKTILLVAAISLLAASTARAQSFPKVRLPSIALGAGTGAANRDESSFLAAMLLGSVRILPLSWVGLEVEVSHVSAFGGGETSVSTSLVLRVPGRVSPFATVGRAFHRERTRSRVYANHGKQFGVGVDVRLTPTASLYGQQIVIPTSNYISRYEVGIRYAVSGE